MCARYSKVDNFATYNIFPACYLYVHAYEIMQRFTTGGKLLEKYYSSTRARKDQPLGIRSRICSPNCFEQYTRNSIRTNE